MFKLGNVYLGLANILRGLPSYMETHPKSVKYFMLGFSIICFANYFMEESVRSHLKYFSNVAFNTGLFWLVFFILTLISENTQRKIDFIGNCLVILGAICDFYFEIVAVIK